MVSGLTLFFWDAIVARFFSVERCIASRVITDLEADPSDNVSLKLGEILAHLNVFNDITRQFCCKTYAEELMVGDRCLGIEADFQLCY